MMSYYMARATPSCRKMQVPDMPCAGSGSRQLSDWLVLFCYRLSRIKTRGLFSLKQTTDMYFIVILLWNLDSNLHQVFWGGFEPQTSNLSVAMLTLSHPTADAEAVNPRATFVQRISESEWWSTPTRFQLCSTSLPTGSWVGRPAALFFDHSFFWCY